MRHLTGHLPKFKTGHWFRVNLADMVSAINRLSECTIFFESQFKGTLILTASADTLDANCFDRRYMGHYRLPNEAFSLNQLLVKASDFATPKKPKGNLRTTDLWNGYPIYRIHPKPKVIVDEGLDISYRPCIEDQLNEGGPAQRLERVAQ